MRGVVRYAAAVAVALSVRDVIQSYITRKGGGLQILPRFVRPLDKAGSLAMESAARDITVPESRLIWVKMEALNREIQRTLGVDIEAHPQVYTSFVVGILSERIVELNERLPADPRLDTLESLQHMVSRIWNYFSSRTRNTENDRFGQIIIGIWEDIFE